MRRPFSRTSALAILIAALGAGGLVAGLVWPSSRPALDCPPQRVRWVGEGAGALAVCDGPGGRVPAGPAMTLRLKLDLNSATPEELAMVSGIGPALARAISAARAERAGFATWAEVDAISGLGPAKLLALQNAFELRAPGRLPDGGAPVP